MASDFAIIGQRLKRARLNKKMTQDSLAKQLGVSVAFLSRIESGTSHVNLKRLSQICDILGVTEGEILNGPLCFALKLSYICRMVCRRNVPVPVAGSSIWTAGTSRRSRRFLPSTSIIISFVCSDARPSSSPKSFFRILSTALTIKLTTGWGV